MREHIRLLCGIRHGEFTNLADELERVAVELLNRSGDICKKEVRSIRAVSDALLNKVNDYGRFALNCDEIDAALNSVEL